MSYWQTKRETKNLSFDSDKVVLLISSDFSPVFWQQPTCINNAWDPNWIDIKQNTLKWNQPKKKFWSYTKFSLRVLGNGFYNLIRCYLVSQSVIFHLLQNSYAHDNNSLTPRGGVYKLAKSTFWIEVTSILTHFHVYERV